MSSNSRNTINVIVQMLIKVRVTTCIPYKGCTQLIINSIALQMFTTKQVVVTKSGTYEEILDISLFFTLILTFSCCSLSMANTGDEVIYLHYFNFVNFYKKV